jgi:hypothetical protein
VIDARSDENDAAWGFSFLGGVPFASSKGQGHETADFEPLFWVYPIDWQYKTFYDKYLGEAHPVGASPPVPGSKGDT